MQALDGNAIAGSLMEHFGREMTTEAGACKHCGTVTQVAELRVYVRAPGSVARCPTCGEVVLVLLEIRGEARVHSDNFAL
jgi:Family of unknown function (DUF6510)